MNKFNSIVNALSIVGKWIALTTMTLMMFYITFAVLNRQIYKPIIGDVELVQLMMIILIMFGLGYSQSQEAHVSISIIVDRFPEQVQNIIIIIGYILTFIVTVIVAWVTLGIAIDEMKGSSRSTDLLEIPFWPFRYIISLGFVLWGLEALKKSLNLIFGVKETT